jgi:transcription-repair coupling factor (superfamily II helicase)
MNRDETERGAASPLEPRLPSAPGRHIAWEGLHGAARAIALATAARSADLPLLVLAGDPAAAERLLEELRFFRSETSGPRLLSFPAWETLPYDRFSPYQDIVSERLATLRELGSPGGGTVLVVPVSTVMQRLLPADFVGRYSLVLQVGESLDVDRFRAGLVECGYRVVSQVTEHGDLAVRGSLLDLFPMGAALPYRIDLFDDRIDSIRSFDPETQRSVQSVDRINLLPAREVVLTPDTIARFRAGWRSRFAGNPAESPVYRDVSDGIAPAGIEYYLPLFYESTHTLFDYLHNGCIAVFDDGAREAAQSHWAEIGERYEQGRHDRERPLLPPEQVFLPPDDLFALAEQYAAIDIRSLPAGGPRPDAVRFATRVPVQLPVDARAAEPCAVLKRFLDGYDGRVLLAAESAGRRETILELLGRQGLHPARADDWNAFLDGTETLALTVAPLDRGAMLDAPRLAVISESQLFGDRVQQRRLRRRRQQDADAIVRDLVELTPGAPVVHEQHGVGRYRGLVTLVVDDVPAEFLCLEYDQGDKLYVPVSSLDLISRFTGVDPEHAPLHRLGSGQWQKARRRAAEKTFDVAAELLELHARRAARPGTSYEIDEDAFQAFAQAFPFEETPGQMDAIDAVVADLREAKPMDRLICGDAGFGKTEVAMRAAFITAHAGRQVALLVPTTLLAQQHFQTFSDRFADWPLRIEVLSRFVPRKEQEKIIADIAAGKVDIVIGTHRLLQKDIRFARLGLLIIDEEHRFGVRQKERFKALRAEVDVLTLTATPIPRTLSMALSDLRELSIIATPPSRRLAVKTFVREWDDGLITEALQREIRRGGQVYFLHNEVDSIENSAHRVESLLPEARVRVAHGQMPERELERVMLDFYHRRFNVLVCTTIIETGIDVPNANTIIVNRADRFGLAQLYQLRGRVGRSHHRAYAFLIIPSRRAITTDAVRRLEAIEALEELGIGFTLAIHDLEIRGAGEILGEEQSGEIQQIGFGMYMDLLDRAVRTLRGGGRPLPDFEVRHGPEIDLRVPALIPDSYLPDVHARLVLYKRIAGAGLAEDLVCLREEIIDRFGPLPAPLQALLEIARLKQRARALGMHRIDLGPQGGRLQFDASAAVDPARVVQLIQSQPQTFRFDGRDRLRISAALPDAASRIRLLMSLFDSIETKDAA